MSASSPEKLRRAVQYCMQLVRQHDYEHYLAALYLPPKHRPAQFIIRAFNVETALAADKTKEQTVALMRLTWWRDRLDAMNQAVFVPYNLRVQGGASAEQPVLQALGALRDHTRLSPRWFSRILDARMDELTADQPPHRMADLESYAESTSSALLYLGLESAGIRDVSADHAASHVGKAEGMALLLRAASWHAAKRRSHIPLLTAAKHGLVHEDVYRGRSTPPFRDACLEVAQVALNHLKQARDLLPSVPKEARPFLLPAVGAGMYLHELEKKDFNALDPSSLKGVWGVSPLWLHVQLFLTSSQKKF